MSIFRIEYNFQLNDKIFLTLQGSEIIAPDKDAALALATADTTVKAYMREGHILLEEGSRSRWIGHTDTELYSFDVRNALNLPKRKPKAGWTIPNVFKLLQKNKPLFAQHIVLPVTTDAELIELTDPGILALLDWGFNIQQAEKTLLALKEGKKIVIAGETRSGKSKLLNQLIRMKPNHEKFYFYHHPDESAKLDEDNEQKSAMDYILADYNVVDDVNRKVLSELLIVDKPQLVAIQIPYSADSEGKFPDHRVAIYADLFILTAGYKKVADVREVTERDKILLQQYA